MNISILGYTGSGKTTAISTMLTHFYEDNVENFQIRGADNTNITRLTDLMRRINVMRDTYSFPDATSTSQIDRLQLKLFYKNIPILDFGFIDYAGGLLNSMTDAKRSEVIDTLCMSEVVLVFTDASRLKEIKDDTVARKQLGIMPITEILTSAIESLKYAQKKLTIIFCLTQIDSSNILPADIELLKKRIGILYNNFFLRTSTQLSDYVVFETGNIGYGNVTTKKEVVTLNDGGRSLRIINEINYGCSFAPINILSVLAKAFIYCHDNMFYDMDAYSNLIYEKEKKFGKLFQLFDLLFRRGKKQDEIEEMKKILKLKRDNIARLGAYKLKLENIVKERR